MDAGYVRITGGSTVSCHSRLGESESGKTRSGVRLEIRCGMEESPSGCYGRSTKGRPYKPWASKPEDLVKSNIPAFPGAEGGGMYTPGGRGGKVIVVTSLEDSGPGTLREACETGGARVIVFNVSGVIRLKAPISCVLLMSQLPDRPLREMVSVLPDILFWLIRMMS